MTNEPINIKDISQLAIDASKSELIDIPSNDGHPKTKVLVLPKGKEAISAEKFLFPLRENPKRRKGIAYHNKLDSFIEHVNRFKSEHSAIFGDFQVSKDGEGYTIYKNSLTCVFDYHDKTYEGTPRFCEHKSRYDFPLSKQWIAWNKSNQEKMTQDAFAYFLEENIMDVVSPVEVDMDKNERIKKWQKMLGGQFAEPAKLMELSKGLSINVDSKIVSKSNLQTGEHQIVFEEEHKNKNGDKITVPNMFLISIPIFENSKEYYVIAVRLRYRARNGAITWGYDMESPEKYIDDALIDYCNKVREATSLPVFSGTPERE